jgi:hypothetical protein
VTPSAPSGTPAPRAEAPLAFDRTQIRLDSTPSHADVKDPASGKVLGQTPFTFSLPSSRTAARQFGLHRKGYVDVVVELVPDRPRIEYTEKLERGAATAAPVVHQVTRPDPGAAKPDPGAAKPDPGAAKPDPGAAKPDPGAAKPDPAATNPDPGATKPDPPPLKPPTTKPDPVPPAVPDPDTIMLKPDPSRTGSGSGTP